MDLKKYILIIFFVIFGFVLTGQTPINAQSTEEILDSIQKQFENLNHRMDMLQKQIDDVLWYQKVEDVVYIDKVRIVGPPPAVVENPTAMGAGNPVKFYAYIFIPKSIDRSKKYPCLVFPHGGVHADFTTYYTHIIRELAAQG